LGPAAALLCGWLLLVPPQAGSTAPAPAQDQGAAQGIVEEVRFEGSKRLGEDALRLQVRTQKGKPYSAKTVDDDIKALAKLQFIASSPPPERLESGGLRVIFRLDDVPTVRRVRFVGNKELDEEDLRKALGLSQNGVMPASMLGMGLRVLVRKLEEKYQEEGYLHVEIDPRPEAEGDGYVLVFHIMEGPQVHVDHVDFEGLEEFAPRHLRQLMKTSRSFWIFTQTYKPDVLEGDVMQIEQFLRDEGWLDARVAVESVTSNAIGDTVDILIRIDQGRRYTVRSIKFAGNEKFPTSELVDADLVQMRPGMPYRQSLYQKDRTRIRKYYRHRGFVEVEVPFRPEETWSLGKAEVDLVIRIREDEPKRVRDVRVVGNKNTRDEVVRRELDLHPGELFDGDEMDLAEDRLRTRGYFADEQGRPLAWVEQQKTDDPRVEDVVMRVEDNSNGIFSLFGGLASGQGFFVGLSLSIENFGLFDPPSSPGALFEEFLDQRALHGDGQKLRLTANPGNKYSNYLLDFNEPYLNGPVSNPFFLNVNLHLHEYVDRLYNEEITGATVTVGKRLTRDTSVSLGLRNDRVVISDVPPQYLDDTTLSGQPIEDLIAANGGNTVRGVIAGFNWQKFDSLRNPTSGRKLDLAGELLGGGFGGDVDVYKLSASAELLLPTWRNEEGQAQVFSNRAAVGYANNFGDSDEVLFYERYFSGGPGGFLQMRGFSWRGVGPHDQSFSEGGNGGWVANTEYVFPLMDTYDARLRENQPFLRGLLFFDQGQLSSDWEDLLHDRWRASVGVGIRLRIPIQLLSAPLELYYGVPIQRTREDERESFQINFSTRF
jgi:outer membrane protein insertion porin family